MRIGHFDCFSGVSGDMWVGALLDLGLPLLELEPAVRSLGLSGVTLRAEKVRRASIAGTRFVVDVAGPGPAPPGASARDSHPQGHDHGHPGQADSGHPHHGRDHPDRDHEHAPHHAGHSHGQRHRNLADIQAILKGADLPGPVRDRCLQVFAAIGEAEARAHDMPIDQVHFHEVGAEDTIVDVVCACLGTHLLGLQRLTASAVVVGSGTVRCAHGVMPVPAPGTLDLLFGIPVRISDLPGERTTPTGAALLKVLVDEFEPTFTWLPDARGYGAGTRDDRDHPNLLRLTLGTLRDPGATADLQEICCNLDTATGETVGWLLEELLRCGAVDAFATPVQMKKGRPGFQVTALCSDGQTAEVVRLLLEESSSLGVRSHRVSRSVLERWQETVTTDLGPVQFKVARLPSGALLRRPEDDEVRRLAAERGLSRAEVLRRLGGV